MTVLFAIGSLPERYESLNFQEDKFTDWPHELPKIGNLIPNEILFNLYPALSECRASVMDITDIYLNGENIKGIILEIK